MTVPSEPAAMASAGAIEAEQSVLGALLLDAETAGRQIDAEGLTAADFHERDHGLIFAAIMRLRGRGEPVDYVSVYAELAGGGEPAALPFLVALTESVPSARNAGHYARLVRRTARRRHISTSALALHRAAASPNLDDAKLAELGADLAAQLQASTVDATALPVRWAASLGDQPHVPPQLIEGLLTAGGISGWMGASNSGKTYVINHAGLCIASGRAFLGRRVRKCPVVYVAAEGSSSVMARWQAHAKHFGDEPGPLALVPQTINMLDPSADVDALIATVRQVGAAAGQPVGLVVVDTVARVMVGGDENTAVDMGRLIGAADRVREATGAHVALVHHTGKDASKGARGHSSLKAALDTEIEVSVDDALRLHTVKVTKQRDLPSKGETFACKFIPVELGTDEWGNAITACAVVQAETAPSPSRGLTVGQRQVLSFMQGRGTGMKRAAVAAELVQQGMAQASVYRAINDLVQSGQLMLVQGQVYLPREGGA